MYQALAIGFHVPDVISDHWRSGYDLLNLWAAVKERKKQGAGVWPVCYKRTFGSVKLRGHKENSSAEEMPYYDIPGQITIEEYLKSLEK